MVKANIVAKSPLKLILFGEHSVISGGRCLAVAIEKYGYLEINGSPDSRAVALDVNNNELDLGSLGYVVPGMEINILLEAPLGRGLGTSGATSLLLSYARTHKTATGLLEDAHRIEDIFHGKSSGVDVSTCYTGGLISFKRGKIEKLPTCYLQRFKIMFFDSKIPKNTAAAIKVGEAMKELYFEIEKVSEEAYELLQNDFTLQELYKLIRRNQELLDELGVCPDEMKVEVDRMRKLGVETKVTGAGCGGCLVTVVDKNDEFPGWTSVSMDLQGFCVFS